MLNHGHKLDGKYEVVKTLGQGGMSTVYLCKNIRLDNLWAIKEIKKKMEGYMDFLAEPNILKNLSHPGIPRVVDIFYEDDNLYIVEDYIEGQTLQDYVKNNGSVKPEQIGDIGISICEIIEYLHSFNPPIIYRDLKPSNIMITPSGRIVLIDFGISRIYKKGGDKDTIYMGSKGYAAPEQYGTEQTCKQTDIYGLGAVIYFMVSGKAPAVLLEPLKDENYGSEVSFRLKRIIQRAMQIDIIDRYPSVEIMKKELADAFSKEEDYTRTLLMGMEQDYDKTLLMDIEKNQYTNNLEEFRTRATNKSELRDLIGIPNSNKENEEASTNTTTTEKKGKINFYKINKEEEQSTSNNSGEEIKVKKDISKKDIKKLKRNLVLILTFVAFIFILGYLVTDHGKKDNIIDQGQTTSEENTSESTQDEKKEDINEDGGNSGQKEQPVNVNSSQSTPTVNSSTNNTSLESLDNYSGDKKDSKGKGNGKAKGKNKNDD
ncbi:serine/threonine-protein kinase [Clostridium sp. A1-XYC3]|uniref:non-specific serine/threonine protein kinase n=1 Tax=Clostridium tanneri TaxID=3037988 RepID=A0ABU4JXU6_9CLOT|nr:serine/threonine-protein kinase [Clostridium sp. A1-XYC3]MDW8802984.1 serine/threonine-protein kinase [Clostridium sp. A1-XYC3]